MKSILVALAVLAFGGVGVAVAQGPDALSGGPPPADRDNASAPAQADQAHACAGTAEPMPPPPIGLELGHESFKELKARLAADLSASDFGAQLDQGATSEGPASGRDSEPVQCSE